MRKGRWIELIMISGTMVKTGMGLVPGLCNSALG
jgi:hypothetical protein